MKKQASIRLIIATLIVPGRTTLLLLFVLFAITTQAQRPPMLMRLVADGNLMQNETVVYFDSAATYNYDAQYDAPSLGVNDGFLNIVTRLNSIDYRVNAVPSITQNMTIPVKITTGTSGMYSVYANDLKNLPEGAYVHLRDTYNSSDFNLRNGATQYYISDTETVARFQLIISVNSIHNVMANATDPTCAASANGSIYATAAGAGPFNYYWKDSLNNLIRVALNKGAADTLTGANAGVYRVDVTTPGTNNNATVYLKLQGSLSARADFHLPAGTVSLYNGIANVHFTNASQNAQSYAWNFGDGMGSSFPNPNHSYNQVGTYTVTLTASNNACSDISVRKEVLTVDASMLVAEPAQYKPILGADAAGYYVTTNASGAKFLVTDLLGRELMNGEDLSGSQKIYLSPSLPKNEILLIRVASEQQIETLKFLLH